MKTVCTADAAIRLMVFHHFWNELYYSMKVVEDSRPYVRNGNLVDMTLATDGLVLIVNPEFWRKLSLEHKLSALAHEICHKMFLHSTRRRNRDPFLWNVACDHVVNITLQKNKFVPIPGYWICDMKYDGWSAEAVYADIIKSLPPPPKGGGKGKPQKGGKGKGPPADPSDSQGEVESSPYEDMDEVPEAWKQAWRDIRDVVGTSEEIEKFEQAVEHAVQKALASARAMGKAPAGIEMEIKRTYEAAEEPWYNHLHRYMQSMHTSEFNWRRINRRAAAVYGMFAPANFAEALGEVVILIDCSGSCYDKMQQANFATHVSAIMAEAKPSRLIVAYFDTKVHFSEEVDPGELEFRPHPHGGGGTDFSKLFTWIDDEGYHPEVAIVLTDMMGSFPAYAPEFPVVWADTYHHSNGAPFGEYLKVK